jgi:Domain of unknown function (DUF4258)
VKFIFRNHAVKRMFERSISVDDVRAVLIGGRTIQDYPEDTPYPSRLVLGWIGERPLHVVAADTPEGDHIIVTVYEPDPAVWAPGFESKRL